MFVCMQMALAAWRETLGDAHVTTEAERLGRAATATFATTARVLAILHPGTRDEVRACVRIADEHGIAIHPVSAGKNWGYGSRVPDRDAVVMDLSRLDRIVDFDETLAYVTVEPGVTFRQLSRFLRESRARVFASVTGGPADSSVLANALERGDGSGPLGDRFAHVCGLEVVTASGEILDTGFAGSKVAALGRWGQGPSLDGLFSQSRLGIVTRMTIWLRPYPAAFRLVRFMAGHDGALPGLVDAARGLRMREITGATIPLWNDLKALTLLTRYPWETTGGATPLPASVRKDLRRAHGIGAWNGTLSLYGESDAHAAALVDLVVDALAPHAHLDVLAGPPAPLDADPDACGPGLGVPHDRNVASTYWRTRGPIGDDPDGDRCGFLWLSHAVPFRGDDLARAVTRVDSIVSRHAFEPAVAALGITPRLVYLLASITYDRSIDGEDARALACHDELFAALSSEGYPPFRAGVQTARRPPHTRYVELIARALDPRATFA